MKFIYASVLTFAGIEPMAKCGLCYKWVKVRLSLLLEGYGIVPLTRDRYIHTGKLSMRGSRADSIFLPPRSRLVKIKHAVCTKSVILGCTL